MQGFDKEQFLSNLLRLEQDKINHPDTNQEVTLKEFCLGKLKQAKSLGDINPITPILKTALVINWPEKAMKVRFANFCLNYPDIKTLAQLKSVIDSTKPLEFCEKYMGIQAKSDLNPKYVLLKELVEGFLEYKRVKGFDCELTAIKDWARQVNLKSLKDDIIGQRYGVGPGVVGNICLNLGMSIIKPDRHVNGVLQQEFGFTRIKSSQVNDIAIMAGIDRFYLDRVLFEYGKKHGLSYVSNKGC